MIRTLFIEVYLLKTDQNIFSILELLLKLLYAIVLMFDLVLEFLNLFLDVRLL